MSLLLFTKRKNPDDEEACARGPYGYSPSFIRASSSVPRLSGISRGLKREFENRSYTRTKTGFRPLVRDATIASSIMFVFPHPVMPTNCTPSSENWFEQTFETSVWYQ